MNKLLKLLIIKMRKDLNQSLKTPSYDDCSETTVEEEKTSQKKSYVSGYQEPIKNRH